MKDILLNKYTILFVFMILAVSFVGGIDQKKTADVESHGQSSIAID